jgi:hypothetical protein
MEIETFNMDEKPEGWPANAIECRLENINDQLDEFKKNPSYKNKEVLVSLVTDYDLNQRSMQGIIRTTDYEVALINTLFFEGSVLQLNALKTYLYELVGYKTRMQKIASWIPECNMTLEVKSFEGLFPQLSLYYYSYQKFTVEKNRKYSEQLIEFVESQIKYFKESNSEDKFKEGVGIITKAYISLLNDISYFRCKKRTEIWAFERDEIYKLFQLATKLNNLNGASPVTRPLKGVLMTSISNYILKSRNNYNEDYICKYISTDVAEKSIDNNEIWMSLIENLNDNREQRVVSELFKENGWNSYSWTTNINFMPKRKYYVSSFCKSMNDSKMKRDYGTCVYGYKDDRMADILAPIMYWNKNEEEKCPAFSQVVAFDVIYDRAEAKEELSFLCSIIKCFDISDNDKKSFLEEILQYWILSVKDFKWSHERERRYVLFMYDEYDYYEIDTSDSRFLKLKTSLFIQPDFILGENPVKSYLEKMVANKREMISMKPYLFCKDCFNRDFDAVAGGYEKIEGCTLCGSKNVSIENPI